MYTIDVEGTPYYLIPTDEHIPTDGEIYVAVCHDHEIVFPIVIHDIFLSEIADGYEQYATVPWDAPDAHERKSVRRDVEYVAQYYGYRIVDEGCSH